MENRKWNGEEESPPRCLDTCFFKGKTAKTENKTRRKTIRHEGKLQIGEGDTRPCYPGRTAVRPPPRAVVGPTVSPWWPLAGPVFDASRTLRFVLFLVRVLCLCWVILGLFLLSSLIHMAPKHLLITRVQTCKFEICKNTQTQAKTRIIEEMRNKSYN